jgi:hypothetical protein
VTSRHRCPSALAFLFLAAAAAAQPSPFFDPDDFVNPAEHRNRPLFVSRLVAGGVANFVDDARPLRQNVGFLHLANSLYVARFQFDYKHSEVRGEDNAPARVVQCDCPGPIYFPTPPSGEATPEPPLPSRKDTLQVAWYFPGSAGGRIPIPLRYRLSWSRQTVDTLITSRVTGETLSRLHGYEQAFSVDADTHVRIGGRDVLGSIHYGRTERVRTADNRKQNELVYVSRFPGFAFERVPVIFRATLAVGGVTNRAGTALNLVNPTLEAFHRIGGRTRVNVRLVWSPVAARSGIEGWRTTQQIGLFVDRALYVKLFPKR